MTVMLIQLAESVFIKHEARFEIAAKNEIEFYSEEFVVEDLVRELQEKGLKEGHEVREENECVRVDFTRRMSSRVSDTHTHTSVFKLTL